MWGGFESTTYRLQQAGWQLSAEQLYDRDSVRLALAHRDWRLYGISQPVQCRFFERFAESDEPFVVRQMSSDLIVQTIDNLADFIPIDATPQMGTWEQKSIKDFGIFAVPMARTQEIIVEPADVMEMLEKIKLMQAPGQREIRQREHRGDTSQPAQQFHAQILSFREAA